ncbi:MAG: type IV secretion system DNA-binding domain-containing protein [Candidatus Methanomethylicaceae archaeon]
MALQTNMLYVPKVLSLLIKKAILVLVLTTPVWLLYPTMLGYFKKRAVGMMSDQHLRGQKLVSDKELVKLIRPRNISFYIGKIPFPVEYETRHMLIVGRPGTGKTTLINEILLRLREKGTKAIIHDFKGDYVSKFYDPSTDHLFNPLDVRSVHWCPLSEVRMYADVDSIATSLIPESKAQDRFWQDAARDVFSSILHILLRSGEITNQAIWRYASMTEPEMIEVINQAVAQGIEPARRALGYLQGYEKGSKVASDVLSTMKQHTNCFEYMTHLESRFTLREWVESPQGGFLYITNYVNIADTLRPVITLAVDLTIKHLLSLPDDRNRRMFVVLDEFANMLRLSTVVKALETARSKGGAIVIAVQDSEQISRLYSVETAHTIVNTCGTLVSFSVGDSATAKYVSSLFGEGEILETDESLSMGPEDMRDGLSITRRRKTEPVVLPSELLTLPDLHCYVRMLHHPVAKTVIKPVFLPQRTMPLEIHERFFLSMHINNRGQQAQ